MGWKAAQKLIHHWKILRGDNVTPHISPFIISYYMYLGKYLCICKLMNCIHISS